MKKIAFPIVATLLLAACLVAVVAHREQEWFFYGIIVLSSAVGSFMGVNGPRCAILRDRLRRNHDIVSGLPGICIDGKPVA